MGETWHASIGLFSGRPDPEWELAPATAVAFRQRWQALAHAGRPETGPGPPLGYRGCQVRHGDREWRLRASRALLLVAGVAVESRHDAGRELERWLLATAPDGVQRLVAGLPDPAA